MKLLIVGGTGQLGRLLRPALEAAHTCYYLEASPVPDAETRTFVGDLQDDVLIGKAVHGVDRVVWLWPNEDGASRLDRIEDRSIIESISDSGDFHSNIKALYRLLHLAQFSGVLRFVYASSMCVYSNYSERANYPLHELIAPDAWDSYGLRHRLSEAVGQACVYNRPECSFTALRLMHPVPDHERTDNNTKTEPTPRSYPLGSNDLCQLFLAAIAFDRLGYYVLQATGDLEGRTFPNTRAAAVLDWQPQGH